VERCVNENPTLHYSNIPITQYPDVFLRMGVRPVVAAKEFRALPDDIERRIGLAVETLRRNPRSADTRSYF
jgi:hypothetical protein